MRPRYYCDHCKKGTGSPSYMRRHEPSCTNNPNRVCRMCSHGEPSVQDHVAILQRPGNTLEDWQGKMKALREETENCPCCILAAIRQSKVQKFEPADDGYPDTSDMVWDGHTLGFNFKTEGKDYLADRNEDANYAYSYYNN